MTMICTITLIAWWAFGRPDTAEMDRIAKLLGWQKGSVVADVGAGRGDMARYAASVVGPGGVVWATEIDTHKLQALKALESRHPNLRTVAASADRTGLAAGCCDSLVLRGVYHHLSHPTATSADLYRALRPGGRIAVIDFPPKWLLSWLFRVNGTPVNRGGHGVAREVLVRELEQAGFRIEKEIPDWPGGQYCIVATKPRLD